MPYAPDLPDTPFALEESNVVTGGMVNFSEEHLLAPDQVARLLNVSISIAGRRQKRGGVTPRGTRGTSPLPRSLHGFEDPVNNLNVLIAQYGSELYSTPGDSTLTRRATSVSLYDTAYMSAQGRGATNMATLFLAAAVGASDNVSLPYGNLVAVDRAWGFTEVTTVRPRALAWWQARLWAFNSAATSHGADYLLWSNVLDGRNFSNGQSVQIDPDSADPGSAIIPTRGENPSLILYKERSIHLLQPFWQTDGFFPATANALDFTTSLLRPLVLGTGAIATRSVVWVPGTKGADQLFLSREGIRTLARTAANDAQAGVPPPLSHRISETIDRINWAQAHKCVAFHWDGVAYFAVPVDGSVENNHVIAYDVFRDAFFEIDWEVAGWAAAKLASERSFYFLSNSQTSETYNSGSNYTLGSHLFETDTGTADPGGAAIDYDEQTRAFTFPPPGQPVESGLKYRKRWQWIDLAVQAAATHATITFSYRVDDQDEWTPFHFLFVQPDDAYPVLPAPLPWSFAGGTIVRKRVSMHNVPPGYRLQLRIQDDISYAQFNVIQLFLAALPQGIQFR